jgi:CrcB protein
VSVNNVLAVAVGGAVGAVLRYGMTGLAHRLVQGPWPVGTTLVNVVGGFVVGFVAGLALAREGGLSHPVSLFLIVGVCGGFTTFSAFSLETVRLLQAGATATALLSVAVQVVGAFVATGTGLWVARYV